MGAESADVAVRAPPACEHCAGDVQPMVADGVEDAQPSVSAIAGNEDDLHARGSAVQCKEFSCQGKGDVGSERFILLLDLVVGIGLLASLLEDAVALIQVE